MVEIVEASNLALSVAKDEFKESKKALDTLKESLAAGRREGKSGRTVENLTSQQKILERDNSFLKEELVSLRFQQASLIGDKKSLENEAKCHILTLEIDFQLVNQSTGEKASCWSLLQVANDALVSQVGHSELNAGETTVKLIADKESLVHELERVKQEASMDRNQLRNEKVLLENTVGGYVILSPVNITEGAYLQIIELLQRQAVLCEENSRLVSTLSTSAEIMKGEVQSWKQSNAALIQEGCRIAAEYTACRQSLEDCRYQNGLLHDHIVGVRSVKDDALYNRLDTIATITLPLQAGAHFAATTAEKAIQAAEPLQTASDLSVAQTIATTATQTEHIVEIPLASVTAKSTETSVEHAPLTPLHDVIETPEVLEVPETAQPSKDKIRGDYFGGRANATASEKEKVFPIRGGTEDAEVISYIPPCDTLLALYLPANLSQASLTYTKLTFTLSNRIYRDHFASVAGNILIGTSIIHKQPYHA
ncbi:hypothetical protein EYR36_003577 [Pleurotus pulmonarius]|nr:hypothetical protein EYR36_003577 [Pleurotus pulmonarius]